MRELEDPVARLVNDLIDGFVDHDEIDFTAQFSIPFPSQVFLTCSACRRTSCRGSCR